MESKVLMTKETDIKAVRDTSKSLLYAVHIKPDPYGFVSHPYTNHVYVGCSDGGFIDLRQEDARKQWLGEMKNILNNADLDHIFLMLNKAYYLTWLKFVKQHLSKNDFAKLLVKAYTLAENPNMDTNVPVPNLIRWFKEADKKALMTEEEYTYWENLPEEVEIWRGVSPNRCKYGLSWTDDEQVARWFQRRFITDKDVGYLLHAVVPKKHCLAYFNGRDEKEIVLDVNAVKNLIEVIE
jgi:hypothetical protein